MEAPELTNFGSLVRFALQLEASSSAFYRDAVRLLDPARGGELAKELADQHEGRRTLLERTRQQKLNEMVLEPISGLDGSRYVFDAHPNHASEVRRKALDAEDAAGRFYAESAVVAKSLLTEAARTFRKLADENARNVARIRAAFPD